MRRLLLPSLAVAGALAASAAFVLAAGASPGEALEALLDGALLSPAGLGETLTRTTGLLLCALATIVGFRAGVLNVGMEGQFLAGAAAAAAAAPALSGLPPAAVASAAACAALAGAMATLPAALLAERRNVPVVLSTVLLNLVAASAVTWLVRGPLRDPSGDYPQSRALLDSVRLDPLFPGMRVTSAVLVAATLALAVHLLLSRTRPGLALRAVGESPLAARAAGIRDGRVRLAAFAGSGALAGLGGGLEVLAVTGRLYDPFSAGVGFAGIAAALLGGMNPAGALAASFGLAALGAGSSAVQRDAGVPASIATVVTALAVLALLAARARKEPS